MYVHLGGGCLIRAAEIIGIFSVKDNKEFYKEFNTALNDIFVGNFSFNIAKTDQSKLNL